VNDKERWKSIGSCGDGPKWPADSLEEEDNTKRT